ncbi:MAG: hypothetical protein HY727_04845 [Candidatus Rokubacteria bacterium]|nr:hypothetical protein [Candidatus Rokubacteria bacterium]
MLRIRSVGKPFTTPSLAVKGAAALARADAMGLFPERELTVTLDANTFGRLAARLGRAGIGGVVVPMLTSQTLVGESKLLEQYLDQLTEALEASPVPASEWKQLVRILGVDMLERLLGISAPSIRRYARTIRNTPDDVAGRLHWLALIVGALAGAYNEIGIRQWFDRKRVQLDGRTPSQLLMGGWKPEDPGPQRVRSLAHSLAGSPAT